MEGEPVFISALQHFLFCPRQCALIHTEQVWEDNYFTAEGNLLHAKTDGPQVEKRRGVRTVTGMPLASEVLGITGIGDVVEFHAEGEREQAYPVEYKRGRPKPHRADEVQLCAQALCLEEMFGHPCTEGALYYGKTRRRMVVPFDDALRSLTKETITKTRELLESGKTPMAVYERRRCEACSLVDPCLPGLFGRTPDVNAWLVRAMGE